MTKNIHAIERPVRILLGGALVAGGVFLTASSWLGVGVIALGLIPLVTGGVGTCPAYSVLGVSTAGKP